MKIGLVEIIDLRNHTIDELNKVYGLQYNPNSKEEKLLLETMAKEVILELEKGFIKTIKSFSTNIRDTHRLIDRVDVFRKF